MKPNTRCIFRLMALLALLAALSGCARGPRARGTTTLPQVSQPAAAPTATTSRAAQAAPTTVAAQVTSAAVEPAQASNARGDQGQAVLSQINNLDAANQAGDALNDIP